MKKEKALEEILSNQRLAIEVENTFKSIKREMNTYSEIDSDLAIQYNLPKTSTLLLLLTLYKKKVTQELLVVFKKDE